MVTETCRPGFEKWLGDGKDSLPPKGCVGRLKKVPLCSFTWPSNPRGLDYIAAGYSLTPFLVMLVATFYGIYRKTMTAASFIILFMFHHPFTSLLKLIFRQNRPEGSCSNSCGMPSGHSFMAISTLTFILARFGSKRPLLSLVCLITLAPVPWARVQLKDHSVSQVVVGSVLGFIWGFIWLFLQPKLTTLLSQLIRMRRQ